MYRKEIPDGFPKNFLWGGATAANQLGTSAAKA